MELIVKLTQRCNFACTFCSSTEIAESNNPKDDLDLERIFEFLDRFPETNHIIVNGGDPLMSPPRDFELILEYIEEKGLETKLSLISNLWDFYLHPDKWTPLFQHPKVDVSTSFQYGDQRRITKDRVFTEKEFLEIFNLYKDRTGKKLQFISVVTPGEEFKAIDNVRLAKHLDTICNLNYAVASGEQKKSFLPAEMFKIRLDIYKEKLTPWEKNTQDMTQVIRGQAVSCPVNRNCDQGIRVLQPEKEGRFYFSCGAFADDGLYPVDFNYEMSGGKEMPLAKPELFCLKDECLTCPAFQFCNGCYKTIYDVKKQDRVEENCKIMKNIISEIQETNPYERNHTID